jgi:hypothetical protein
VPLLALLYVWWLAGLLAGALVRQTERTVVNSMFLIIIIIIIIIGLDAVFIPVYACRTSRITDSPRLVWVGDTRGRMSIFFCFLFLLFSYSDVRENPTYQ